MEANATRGRTPHGLLTTTEAAPLLGVTDRRVRQLAEAGLLRAAIDTPWGRLFDRAEIERLAAERKARGAQEP